MEKHQQITFKIEEYPLKSYDKVRYGDTDRQGHVNNAVFSEFFETGRVEFLYDESNHIKDKDGSFVIASSYINLLQEIKWPGVVHIGTGVKKVGNSSIHFIQGIFQDDMLVATAETVIVQVDNLTKKSKSLSSEAKSGLEKLLL